ncbi:MAG: ABC transporter ATP-binding protein [Euzebyales bacterium]|nr:ABC transporter ATP-binding protein [Euzebyales bacterium]
MSGLEAVGAVLIFILIGLATDPQGPIDVPVVGDLRARLPALAVSDLIALIAGAVAVFFVIRAFAVLGQTYFQGRVAQNAGAELSVRLLERYLRLPYAFHLRRNSSELIRNANDSVGEIVSSVLMPSVRVVSEGFVVLAVLSVLLVTAPVATALVALVLGPLVVVLLRVVQPRIGRLGRISQDLGRWSLQALQQGLHGYRDITVLGRQDHFLASYRQARRGIARTRYLRAALSELPRVSIETVVVGLIAVFLIISTRMRDDPAGSLAVLGLFAYAGLRIMPALNKVVNNLNLIRFGHAAAEDVQADLALPVPDADDGVDRLDFNQALALQRVSFRYPGTDQRTLVDLDLMIRKGESIGIVGATGAGKSTLVDLIVGLSAATSGRITVDGVDLVARAAAWQRNIGMVSQQVFLLDDTLRRNIALGLPDESIDEQRVRQAISLAQLDDFVARLPDGLNTMVGERGVRVSGGQRQRVAIARALYSRPSVLIFDEGTSALDNLTEAMLVEALAGLREDHTIITVAHRLSTVRDYDRIVFMRDGRIDDIGTFVELGRRNEEFRRLARWSDAAQT